MGVRELTPAQWAFVVILLLLALAGLYYLYTLLCGYRCLPLKTTDCPGGTPHHLVYVNDEELGALAKIAKHDGLPCHGIRSYPPDGSDGDRESESEDDEYYDAESVSDEYWFTTRLENPHSWLRDCERAYLKLERTRDRIQADYNATYNQLTECEMREDDLRRELRYLREGLAPPHVWRAPGSRAAPM